MKLSIIVPCFNEADNVQKLHDELLPIIEEMIVRNRHDASKEIQSAEMIFVDDGSRDSTFSKLQENFSYKNKSGVIFKFLKHETNLGLGAAIRTGFSKADGEIVMTVDSDGTYKFSDIPSFLSFLAPDIDIVTASPYHPAGGVVGVPAYRLFLSRSSSFLYRILVDRHVYTYTCLFRAYRADVIKNISFSSNGFLAGTEILVKAILNGYRVAEFPAVLHRRIYGVSKAKIAETIFSHLSFQGRIFLYRLQVILGYKPKHAF
jgi:dolichol-phosphate mannosyltransferase